jgi:hypothetical protein
LIFFSPKQGLSGNIYRLDPFLRYLRRLREVLIIVFFVYFDVYGIKE